ncbi:MAG: hypothetical protein LBM73_03955 [Candidatus Nomurabacteria bacterium]|jgi:hypothetical protein|nr:hypothetical protein [Candidatus Nomurabacteria bacterium]
MPELPAGEDVTEAGDGQNTGQNPEGGVEAGTTDVGASDVEAADGTGEVGAENPGADGIGETDQTADAETAETGANEDEREATTREEVLNKHFDEDHLPTYEETVLLYQAFSERLGDDLASLEGADGVNKQDLEEIWQGAERLTDILNGRDDWMKPGEPSLIFLGRLGDGELPHGCVLYNAKEAVFDKSTGKVLDIRSAILLPRNLQNVGENVKRYNECGEHIAMDKRDLSKLMDGKFDYRQTPDDDDVAYESDMAQLGHEISDGYARLAALKTEQKHYSDGSNDYINTERKIKNLENNLRAKKDELRDKRLDYDQYEGVESQEQRDKMRADYIGGARESYWGIQRGKDKYDDYWYPLGKKTSKHGKPAKWVTTPVVGRGNGGIIHLERVQKEVLDDARSAYGNLSPAEKREYQDDLRYAEAARLAQSVLAKLDPTEMQEYARDGKTSQFDPQKLTKNLVPFSRTRSGFALAA